MTKMGRYSTLLSLIMQIQPFPLHVNVEASGWLSVSRRGREKGG